jgi:polysaccharide export outer membrane protein
MNPRLSVIQALSLAGGTTAFAQVDNIIIIRESGSDRRVFQFAYSDVSRGRNLDQNIELRSGDVVIVP